MQFLYATIKTKEVSHMAYETKVILTLLARHIGKSKTIKEAYTAVVEAANVEGLQLPSYEQFIEEEAGDE
jgi:effector-binding domain-containing protein